MPLNMGFSPMNPQKRQMQAELGQRTQFQPQQTMQQSPPRFGQARNMFGGLFNSMGNKFGLQKQQMQQPGINPAFNQMQQPGIGLSGIQPPPFQSLPSRPMPNMMERPMPAVQGNIPQKPGFMDRFRRPDFWQNMSKSLGPDSLGTQPQPGIGGEVYRRQDPWSMNLGRQLSQRNTDWSQL